MKNTYKRREISRRRFLGFATLAGVVTAATGFSLVYWLGPKKLVPEKPLEKLVEQPEKTKEPEKLKEEKPPISDLDLVTRVVLAADKLGINKKHVYSYLSISNRPHIRNTAQILRNLDIYTIFGLAYHESGGNHKAISNRNAYGKFQVTYEAYLNVSRMLYDADNGFLKKRKKNPQIVSLLYDRLGGKELENLYRTLRKKKHEKTTYKNLKKEIDYITERGWQRALKDPKLLDDIGMAHFSYLMNEFNNDINLALAAYNAGEGKVRYLGRTPRFRETLKHQKNTQILARYFKAIEDIAKKLYKHYGVPFERFDQITINGQRPTTKEKIEKNLFNRVYTIRGKPYKFYPMEEGGSLSKIAERFQTSVPELKAVNPGLDSRNIPLGKIIRVPNYN